MYRRREKDFRKTIGIDENWMPREEVYDDQGTSAIAKQVREGLILSEAILKFEKHYALHATLMNPSEFVLVNDKEGILVAAKTLQERFGMFKNMQLKTFDTKVWCTMSLQCSINRVRVKNWGPLGMIPEGTVIYVALIYPDSIYYKNLASFGVGEPNKQFFPPNHAMSAFYRNGMIMIPNAWMKFVYHAGDSKLEFEKTVLHATKFYRRGSD